MNKKIEQALVVTLCLQVALANASFTTFIPIIQPISQSLGIDFLLMKDFITFFIVGYVLSSLVIGFIADYIGYRLCALVAAGVYILASFCLLLSAQLYSLNSFRLLQGMAAGVFVITAFSSSAIHLSPTSKKRVFSLFSTIAGLGSILLPILGVYLNYVFGWHSILFILLGLSVLQLLFIYKNLPQDRTIGEKSLGKQSLLLILQDNFKNPQFKHAVFLICAISVFTFGFISLAPFIYTNLFQLTPLGLTLFLCTSSLSYALGAYISVKIKDDLNLPFFENILIVLGLFLLICLSLGYSFIYIEFNMARLFSYLFLGLVSIYFIPLGVVIPRAIAIALDLQANQGAASSIIEFFRMFGAFISVLFIQLVSFSPFIIFLCILSTTTLLLGSYKVLRVVKQYVY